MQTNDAPVDDPFEFCSRNRPGFFLLIAWGGGSVTRFDEISSLLQNFTSLWQISGGLFIIWQIVEPTFGEFVTLLDYFLSGQMAKY